MDKILNNVNKHSTHLSDLQFAIMCDSYYLQNWQFEIIKLLTSHNIRLSLVIFNDNAKKQKSLFYKIIHYKYKYLIFNLYNRFFIKPKSKKPVNISEFIKGVELIKCKTQFKGHAQYFSSSDINYIKEKKLDFILRFGFNIIRGDILNSAKYGVWSFHHDDEQKYRGRGSVFKEILYNDPVNGAILQRLTNRIDAGIILKKGYFKTIKHSLKGSFDNILNNTIIWPLQVCKDIENSVADYFNNEPSKSNAPIKKIEGNLSTIKLLFILLINKIKFHFNELFFTERWIIGISLNKIEDTYQHSKIQNINWLKADKRYKYYADPFAIDYDENKILLFFEEYDYKTRKGKISGSFYNKLTREFSSVFTVLEKSYHLSYPFVFQYNNNWFLMPESANNNELNVYRIHENGTVSYYKTLLHIDAIDATLFQYNDIWWLFFTRKYNSNSNLHIYYSKDIWGPYKPHKNNPVKTDIRSSRPAGTPFFIDGKLIRPAQNSSVYYGSGIEFNLITKLDETRFEEKTIKTLKPAYNKSFKKGIHTIASAGNYIIIDQKQHIFIFASFIFHLKRKFTRFFLRSK